MSLGYISNQAADVVVGQADMTSLDNGISERTTSLVDYACTNGTQFFLTDCGYNRILIFNTLPAINNAAADVVVGQPDMYANGLTLLYNPWGMCTIGPKLFISDSHNNRILVYNSIPTVNTYSSPDLVIGQSYLNSPGFISSDGTHFIVSDINRNRVLIYNSIPTTNLAVPDVAVGQPDLYTYDQGCAANRLTAPTSACVSGGKLIIVDNGNHRVLIFNSLPNTHNASANVVIGQDNFTANTSGCSGTKMFYPQGVYVDSQSRLFITDTSNKRVLIYNTIPTANGAAADKVLGQADMVTSSWGRSDKKFGNPTGISGDGRRLFVSDYANRRALIFIDGVFLDSVEPAQGVTGQQVTVTLYGLGFAPGMTVKLSKTGTDLAAATVQAISSTMAACSFNLNAYPDTFDIKIDKTGFPTATLPNAFSIVPIPIFTPTPAPPEVPSNSVWAAPPDFEGQIISKNYCYAAPNPIRGHIAKIHVYCKQATTVKIKIFTPISREVMSVERYFHEGDNVAELNMSNIANGAYFLFVKARTDQGLEEKVKTKIILLK
jgi:hypothetical protein